MAPTHSASLLLLLSFLAISSTAISSPLKPPLHNSEDAVQVQAPSLLNTKPPTTHDQATFNQNQDQEQRQYIRLDDLTESPSDPSNAVVQSYEEYLAAQGIETGVYAEDSQTVPADLAARLRDGGVVVKGWGSWMLERLGQRLGELEGVWRGEARGEEGKDGSEGNRESEGDERESEGDGREGDL